MTERLDAQLPDRNGDVIADIAIALTRRDDLSDEHRAFYGAILDRFDVLTADRDQALRAARAAGRLPEEDMVEPSDEVTDHGPRIAALEQQYADLADLVHGHSEDLNRVNGVVRELGEALHEHIQVNIDAAQADPADALADLAKALRPPRLTAESDG